MDPPLPPLGPPGLPNGIAPTSTRDGSRKRQTGTKVVRLLVDSASDRRRRHSPCLGTSVGWRRRSPQHRHPNRGDRGRRSALGLRDTRPALHRNHRWRPIRLAGSSMDFETNQGLTLGLPTSPGQITALTTTARLDEALTAAIDARTVPAFHRPAAPGTSSFVDSRLLNSERWRSGRDDLAAGNAGREVPSHPG
jgi:hypothetical protein